MQSVQKDGVNVVFLKMLHELNEGQLILKQNDCAFVFENEIGEKLKEPRLAGYQPDWLVARGFATWKICHRRFATKKIRHTTNVTENLSVSVGQTFATVPMWKIRHTTVIGWGRGGGGGWVGRVGVKGVEVGDVESGEGWGRGHIYQIPLTFIVFLYILEQRSSKYWQDRPFI